MDQQKISESELEMETCMHFDSNARFDEKLAWPTYIKYKFIECPSYLSAYEIESSR